MNLEDQDIFKRINDKYNRVFGIVGVSLITSFYIMFKITKNPSEIIKFRPMMYMTVFANFFGGYSLY